ncbi:hypothetical protein ACIBCT_09395 [Streptosporangium sp. NPDC050855]|uniref:hypothetical protein n=1 Tax=Streptosporangium sp. NPDC050855 TaxID=3366194 RepID=UPI003797419C
MRRRSIVLVAASASTLMFLSAAPAVAAPTDETIVTFAVEAGSLDIVAPPGPIDLGSAPPGGTLTGPIGPVSVSDTRGGATSEWTASVYATNFVAAALTIPPTAIDYWSGPTTATTGGGTFIPGQPTALAAAPLDLVATPLVAFAHTGGTGGSTATWNPTLIVNIPITAQIGAYSGTVTHSVA